MNNYFCNYVLTLKQLKDRFLWRGGRGVKTPLGRYQLKNKKGFFSKGSIFFGGRGAGGKGGRTAYGVASH